MDEDFTISYVITATAVEVTITGDGVNTPISGTQNDGTFSTDAWECHQPLSTTKAKTFLLGRGFSQAVVDALAVTPMLLFAVAIDVNYGDRSIFY